MTLIGTFLKLNLEIKFSPKDRETSRFIKQYKFHNHFPTIKANINERYALKFIKMHAEVWAIEIWPATTWEVPDSVSPRVNA